MERFTELDELGTPHLKQGAEFMIVKDKKGYLKNVYGTHVNKLCQLEDLEARLESLNKKIEKAQAKWKIANDEVESFKKKYIYGKKLSDVPMDLIQKGAELERKERKAWSRCEEISKQLDEMYER